MQFAVVPPGIEPDAKSSASLCTGAESNLEVRVLGEVEKDSFIALPGTVGHSRLLPRKTVCPNPGEFGEEFYSNDSRVGLLTRLGSQVVGLRILRSFSGPFNLASGGFLAAPPLISNCSHLPFGTQGRSWRLESCLQETGDKKGLCAQEPHRATLGFKLLPSAVKAWSPNHWTTREFPPPPVS